VAGHPARIRARAETVWLGSIYTVFVLVEQSFVAVQRHEVIVFDEDLDLLMNSYSKISAGHAKL